MLFPQTINDTKEAKYTRELLMGRLESLQSEEKYVMQYVDSLAVSLNTKRNELIKIQDEVRLVEDLILKTHKEV